MCFYLISSNTTVLYDPIAKSDKIEVVLDSMSFAEVNPAVLSRYLLIAIFFSSFEVFMTTMMV